MKGSCIIDGTDLDDFGMYILKGGDFDFISYPERKEPLQNNWHEENGIDVDLSEVYFNEKDVNVRFYIRDDNAMTFKQHLTGFHKLMMDKGYRSLYSREFDKTFKLRYVSTSDYNFKGGLYKTGAKRSEFTVNFVMDDPLQIFTNKQLTEPINGRNNPSYVKLNGRDLSEYGIIVTQCYNSILQLPEVKSPLTRSFERYNGLLVHLSENNVFEKETIIIECSMLANTLSDFYHNYEALFNNIAIPEALRIETGYSKMKCYYSKMSGFQKIKPFKNGVSVKFNLEFINITPVLINYLLASEDSRYIITENGLYIDMNYGSE